MKKLILMLFVSVCAQSLWAQDVPTRAFSSYDDYVKGIYKTLPDLKLYKRSAMSMVLGGGGGYKIDKNTLDSTTINLLGKDSVLLIGFRDTLYINCDRFAKGSRPGFGKAIEINGTIYFEANLRGEAFTEDADKFGPSAESRDGIFGAAIKKPDYMTRFYSFDPSTMEYHPLQTEKFLYMLKKASPKAHRQYVDKAMEQDDIEALYQSTVWYYLYLIKENSTKKQK